MVRVHQEHISSYDYIVTFHRDIVEVNVFDQHGESKGSVIFNHSDNFDIVIKQLEIMEFTKLNLPELQLLFNQVINHRCNYARQLNIEYTLNEKMKKGMNKIIRSFIQHNYISN